MPNIKETTIEKYYEKIGDPKENLERYKSALNFAIDARKFEIDLYWKRSQYFWSFTALIFGLYAFSWNLAKDNLDGYEWLVFASSTLLLLATTTWHAVISGSKFWQNNWEKHVDLLEDVVHGPIYKTIVVSRPKNEGLFGMYNTIPYSVSKINQTIALISFWISMLLFLRENLLMAYLYMKKNPTLWRDFLNENFVANLNSITVILVICLVIAFLFTNRKAYSDFEKNHKKRDIENGKNKLFLRENDFIGLEESKESKEE